MSLLDRLLARKVLAAPYPCGLWSSVPWVPQDPTWPIVLAAVVCALMVLILLGIALAVQRSRGRGLARTVLVLGGVVAWWLARRAWLDIDLRKSMVWVGSAIGVTLFGVLVGFALTSGTQQTTQRTADRRT